MDVEASVAPDQQLELLGIVADGRRTTTRLLDAEFPKFRQLLPTEHTAMATVEIAPLVDAIKRVALVAERGAQVRLEFADGGLLLSAGGDDAGRAEESLPAEFYGEPLVIAFNPGYLLDGLGSLHTEKVSFGFTTSSRPAVLRPALDEEPEPDASGTFAASSSNPASLSAVSEAALPRPRTKRMATPTPVSLRIREL